MIKYHKIQTIYNRDPETKFKTLLEYDFSKPEFEYLAENIWIGTEKVDGTNIRIGWNGKSPEFGGRTDNAQIPAFLIKVLQEKFTPDALGSTFDFENVVLFGEGYGAKIQKGGGNYKHDGVDFVLFDVWVDGIWLSRSSVDDIASQLDINVVPDQHVGTLYEMVALAKIGYSSAWGAFNAEGLVCRPTTELLNRNGERIITKIKTKDFVKP